MQCVWHCIFDLTLSISFYTMNRLDRPKIKEKQVVCFSVVEQKMIGTAVIADKRPKTIGVLFCLYSGVRIGELLALEWDDVDLQPARSRLKNPVTMEKMKAVNMAVWRKRRRPTIRSASFPCQSN